MDIRAALTNLVALQAGLAITDPVAASIKKAWNYMIPQGGIAPDTPCWMNTWRMERMERGSAVRRQFYTINMQLLVRDADQERAADIATAFHVALVTALDGNLTLGGTVKVHTLRGGDPTLFTMDRAGLSFIGLDEYLDVELWDAATFG